MFKPFELIKKDQYNTSDWSGGTTTQLFIYPKNSSYKERNFKWRISSAKVSVEESEFTHLPGVLRHIMPLSGELKLYHEHHYEKKLKPFEVDIFKGDWSTKSKGKVRDFNLMLGNGAEGFIEALHIEKNQSLKIKDCCVGEKYSFEVETFFLLGHDVLITFKGHDIYVGKEDFLILNLDEYSSDIVIKNTNVEKVSLIRSKIYF